MEIKREKYLKALVDRMHNKLVKVITGIRRVGKSYLLFNIFKHYLLEQGIKDDHIITMKLDDLRNYRYHDPLLLLEFLESQIRDGDMYYILLDEVQLVSNFEGLLNTLLHYDNVDVYVTGSNSKFLSRDIITGFRGRGDEVHVYPLTFKEFMQVYDGDVYHGWSDYITYGGLPLILSFMAEEQKIQYLNNLFEETYIKDLKERNNIEKFQELNDLINVIASSIGFLSNPTKIANTFHSSLNSTISVNTIAQYLEYLEDAFLISKVDRYDVKGRKYIGSPVKYYFEDIGLRNARLGFRQIEEPHLMENVIYNELRTRGFLVDVGIVNTRTSDSGIRKRTPLEIDFVSSLGSKRYYIQSALAINDLEKEKQEKASLLNVNDSFKKIVVVKDVMNIKRDVNGITTIGLYDFLLNPNSLDA